MYPATGFTKGEVIDYYARIAPVMLPHLAGRPITLKRYPNGVDGQSFYEKNCPKHRPDWLSTVEMTVSTKRRDVVNFCLLEETASLVWTANLAALELHPGVAVAADLDRPTYVVFDLDPGPPANVIECGRVAMLLREVLDRLGLAAWVKTSGSKGLQMYVPVNAPATFADTRDFSLALAQLLEKHHGDLVVTSQAKELRPGKVLIDWSQNARYKTTVAVYSLRARERPTVSTPVTWDEVDDAVSAGEADRLRFETADVLERVERDGDGFAPVLEKEQELPALTSPS
jgi:bifunctional non-homologous end joining protein LigD